MFCVLTDDVEYGFNQVLKKKTRNRAIQVQKENEVRSNF